MTEVQGRGQADKKAAEQRTAEVDEQNRQAAQKDQETTQNAAADVQPTAGTDNTPERTDDAPERRAVDAVLDPYPEYEQKSREELRALAESRGVEINRDVEKAQLIKQLRDSDIKAIERGDSRLVGVEVKSNVYASYDVVPLEQIRELAQERDIALDEDFETAHLITELRAADTGVAGTGVSVRLADGTQK